MGRVQRQQCTVKGLAARAAANGYKRGAHKEQDRRTAQGKHVKKTIRDHDRTLRRYVMWHLDEMRIEAAELGLPPPTEEVARTRCLRPGIPAPDLVTVKDFIRFYIATSHPQLDDVPTVDSINTVAEWFFAGFTRVTGTATNEEERSEVYNWVRYVLTAEGIVVKKKKNKHNFSPRDLRRIQLTAWTKNDLIYIHERNRIQFTFIIRVYCWTGARLSAFFTDGLRYRDVELVLQRTQLGGWRLIYRIDQRWVKNNRDPENIVFGTAGREHEMFIYDDAAFLLHMAIADHALHGFETLSDVREQQIPAGDNELPLRFRDEVLDKPILRRCTMAEGVTEDPMPKSTFSEIFRSTLRNAGYLCGSSIHAIRRSLGKKVNKIYTQVELAQHLTQGDTRVFGESYLANMSAVDGQGAFLGETVDHSHVEYFQSLEKFREEDLPTELPAQIEDSLKLDPCFRELEAEAREGGQSDPASLEESKKLLASYMRSLRRKALRKYQEDWIRERRDWKVATRGKQKPEITEKTVLVDSLCLLFPERARLAQRMASEDPLSAEDKWLVMDDLYTLCTRDYSVLYLPECQPINGRCPVKCCQLDLDSLAPRSLL